MLCRVMAVPATVVYFTTYEQLKAVLGHRYDSAANNWWKPVAAGASARGKLVNLALREKDRLESTKTIKQYLQNCN